MFSERILKFQAEVERNIQPQLQQIDALIDQNQWKVIRAFQAKKVSEYHFSDSTGYAYNDRGREVLDNLYAAIFRAESALVRPHFVSGTHAIAAALYGVLRPGDELMYITGTPYDTLHPVIGVTADGSGSLQDWGVRYKEVSLLANGDVDWSTVQQNITEDTKMIAIQRSCGYAWRSSFGIEEIASMVSRIKALKKDVVIFVDNCYGEFTQSREPIEVGVDLMAGSLIKNVGGGIAPTGGYVCGKQKYVDLAANRLTAPGIGGNVGAMLGTTRLLYQGMYMAPATVGQALKGSIFASAMFEKIGLPTKPHWQEERTDIIQAVKFQCKEHLTTFIQAIQCASAVDSHVTPEPWDMPGYDNPVIMAAGTFVQGASIELSADAIVREPYVGYMQGGLTYAHVKYGVLSALQQLNDHHFI